MERTISAMTEELGTQVREVARLRQEAVHASEARTTARVQWENEHREILDAVTNTAKLVEEAEAGLRELTLLVYAETKNKAPAPGVGIREVTKLEYDTNVALSWAKEHGLALKLDVPSFEKIAKAEHIAFVTISQIPQATIASVLPTQ